MSKPFAYWVRLALVATLCTLITFSPVSAGKWMDRLLHRDGCKTTTEACVPAAESPMCLVVPACESHVMPVAEAVSPSIPSADCQCDSAPVEMTTQSIPRFAPTQDQIQAAVPPSAVWESSESVVTPAVPTVLPPVESAPKSPPATEMVKPTTPSPTTVPTTPVPAVQPPVTPITPVVDPKPAPTPPADASPFDDPMPESEKPDTGSLFNDEPAATPESEMPSDLPPANNATDDLFSSEKTDSPALNDMDAEPATTDSVNDLFADPTPAKATDDSGLDSLFDTEPTKEGIGTEDATTPAGDDGFGDLFGKPVAAPSGSSETTVEPFEPTAEETRQ
jgi:hypothetical protein